MKADPGNASAFWLKYICHRNPSRSFFIKGKQMPLCARCTGLYTGFIIGIITMIITLYLYPNLELTSTQILLILAVGVIPFAIDGVTQFWGLRESTNIIRVITGGICGVILATTLFWIGYDIII